MVETSIEVQDQMQHMVSRGDDQSIPRKHSLNVRLKQSVQWQSDAAKAEYGGVFNYNQEVSQFDKIPPSSNMSSQKPDEPIEKDAVKDEREDLSSPYLTETSNPTNSTGQAAGKDKTSLKHEKKLHKELFKMSDSEQLELRLKTLLSQKSKASQSSSQVQLSALNIGKGSADFHQITEELPSPDRDENAYDLQQPTQNTKSNSTTQVDFNKSVTKPDNIFDHTKVQKSTPFAVLSETT